MGIITILWEKWVEFRRDFYKITLAAMIAPLMYLIVFGMGIQTTSHGQPYLNFLIPGVVSLTTMNGSFNAIAQNLNVRQTEALAKRLSNPKEERKPTNDELIAESYGRLAAQELSDKIGRTCRIVSGKKKGRIELDYYGIDDLNDLLEALAAIKRRKNGDE